MATEVLTTGNLIGGVPVMGAPMFNQTVGLTAPRLLGGTPVLPRPVLRTYPYWPIPADWANPVLEEVSFRTEIIKSRDGSEQRIAQRVNPRYMFRWSSLAWGDQLRTADRVLSRRQAYEFKFDHPRAVILADRAHPAASGFFGRFTGSQSISAITDGVGQLQTEVQVTPGPYPGDYLIGYSYGSAPVTYRSLEVFELSPNWAANPQIEFTQTVENFGFERGVTDFFTPETFTVRRIELGYMIRNEAQENAVRGLFYRSKGRQKEFYIKDPLTSLKVVAPIAAGATTLTILGTATHGSLLFEPTYRNVAIVTGSTTHYRRIDDISVSGGNTILTLDTSLPEIDASELVGVSWLLKCRFETDVLSMNWVTDMVARVVLNVRTLEDAT